MVALWCMMAMSKAFAGNYINMEPLKLDVPELKPELVLTESRNFTPSTSLSKEVPGQRMDFDFFKTKTNPGVKPFKVMDDLTFVGIPLFAAGWAIKGDKAMFRVNNKDAKENTQLLTNFKTGIDDEVSWR